jgi:Nif-specific regulatory protein
MGEGVAGWVAKHGQAIRLSEREAEHRIAQRIDQTTGYRTRNMVAAPVLDTDGTVIGVLQLLNKRDGDFTSADLRRLREIGHEVTTMLQTTSLAHQLRPDHRQPLAFRFNHIIGDSAPMQDVYEKVERAARTEVTVAIRGETGTGKELIARAIHFNSQRRAGPFIKVDCAALPESLIENELFGHVRGAFTSADQAAEGKVAAAEGGTLFLDEIAELPVAVQGKLLRLLQERTYHQVGGTQVNHAQVRFVAATNRDLEKQVDAGGFRQDLYYRLRVVEITVPPLRARGHGDIDRLLDHFLYEYTRRHGRAGLHLTEDARAQLHAYAWPGNVRELEHCVESVVILAPDRDITVKDLPLRSPEQRPPDLGQYTFAIEPTTLQNAERAYIQHIVTLCNGNQSEAARRLAIGRNTLARKLKNSSD